MKIDKNSLMVVGTVLIIVAFFGGMKYGEHKNLLTRSFTSTNGLGTRVPGQGGQFTGRASSSAMASRNGIIGQIIAKDDSSITVKLQDGGSKIVFYTNTTSVNKSVVGSVDDLSMNQNIIVTGEANSDGSINAQSIQLRSDIPTAREGGPKNN